MTGRAKGRARGRARGAAQDQPAPRPGEQTAPAPNGDNGNGANGDSAPISGRASHRGGARGEPRPGGEPTQAPTGEMAAMSLGTGEPARTFGMRDYGEPHTRPAHVVDKRGKSGTPIPVQTNYFRLVQSSNWQMYQYRVDFTPAIEQKTVRQMLVKQHRELLGETRAYDSGNELFMLKKLEQKVTEVISERRHDGAKIQLTFTLTNELPPTSPTCLHMYNVIFKRILNAIQMQQIGRNYYLPTQNIPIPQHKLEVWPGYVTSIAQMENSVMLCADISHKILRTDTVLDLMQDLYQRARQNFHSECTKKLLGQIVLTRYNNQTYRIDDIDWDANPTSTFNTRREGDVAYTAYYKQHYNIQIGDLSQPLLTSKLKKSDLRAGKTQDFKLIPELCTLTGLSDEVRADFHVMKDIAVHTRIKPSDRQKTLRDFIQKINNCPEAVAELKKWGLKFDNDLVKLQARVLPAEPILQADKKFGYNAAKADWGTEMRGAKLLNAVSLHKWVILATRKDLQLANDFVQTIGRVAPPMGIRCERPEIRELPNDRTETFTTTLRNSIQPDTQIVVCILPTNRKDRYDAVKKFCCIEHAVPSQVVVARTLSKPKMLMSICTKIAIQLNCKMGGEVWALEIPMKGVMVVGIDSYHDSSQKGRSVGAFIASINGTFTRYYSAVNFQHNMQEILDGLVRCMQSSLAKYHEVNGTLPQRIIIYRDGVGDGQLPAVVKYEVPQIQACFKNIGADYNPRLAFIVVKKKINSRFFAAAGGQGLQNPPPGTIVDSEVTKPDWYDFFLVSQSVNQGTVTPSHYNVIWDTSGLQPDHIQRLTYKLCHLYYNWPGTIRVPAPCQYAHKLAFLVGQSLHKDPSRELSDKLYFL